MGEKKMVVCSFIGAGKRLKDRKGYEKTEYYFKESDIVVKTSFFGIGLIKNVLCQKEKIDKWIIIGTPTSSWSEIIEVVDKNLDEETENVYEEVYNEEEKGVSKKLLKKWEILISKYIPSVNHLRFYSVNSTDYEVYPLILLNELETAKRYDIVFDLTHAFRHMPIIFAFSLMFVKNLRDIDNIDIYYGAFEMKGQDSGLPYTPVLKLEFVNELSKMTEAVALYKYSGYFSMLLEILGYKSREADKLYFLLEMNRPARKEIEDLLKFLNGNSLNKNDYMEEVADILKKDFEKIAKMKYLYERMFEKSIVFYEKNQYFKALILLYEAIIAKVIKLKNLGNPMDYEVRDKAKKLIRSGEIKEIDKEVFEKLAEIRNAAVHATEEYNNDYLHSKEDFEEFFEKCSKLFGEISERR